MSIRYKMLCLILAVFVATGLADNTAFSQTPTKSIDPPTQSLSPRIESLQISPVDDLTRPPKGDISIPHGAPPLGVNWGGFTFDTNAITTPSWYFIPPDPIGAAGPLHVVNVGNVSIEWFDKTGTCYNPE